ncbi:sulfur carrier protein ThiS [Gracilibacillus sp. YIM 98692]|uniref:sulfur carrier protein ThiS n=1 Tax=Gracilibacillus sp. YIM 98692 TaxID=2663532 RepID=UPI0013D780B6|nr:sulfur carrier protein ThiS [Gracilibacillus sp. YIM 98692]
MQLQINGDQVTVEQQPDTIAELLEHLNLQGKSLIVEHNQVILKKRDHQQTKVSDGDQLEIVHFVGGG